MSRNLNKTIARLKADMIRHTAAVHTAKTKAAQIRAYQRASMAHAEFAVAQHRQTMHVTVEHVNKLADMKPGRRYPHQVEVNDMHDLTKGDVTPYLWALENLKKPWRVYYMHGTVFFGSTCGREAMLFKMFWA